MGDDSVSYGSFNRISSSYVHGYNETEVKILNMQIAAANAAAQGTTSSTGVTRSSSTYESSLQDFSNVNASYNAERGNALLKCAMARYGNDYTAGGYCATGVSEAIGDAFGYRTYGNGNDYGRVLSGLSDWKEVTSEYPNVSDLANLPPGAIVTWTHTGPEGTDSWTYGHVYISDGNGGEISDYHCLDASGINASRANYGTYRVFIPV